MMRISDIKSAITLFQEAANKQAAATESGDYKAGNKSYNLISKAAHYLKSEDAISELKPLLCSCPVGVRLWSAYYLLPLYEKECLSTLEKIVEDDGIHSLTAETTISEWKKGNLKIY